jgi:carboxylesterase
MALPKPIAEKIASEAGLLTGNRSFFLRPRSKPKAAVLLLHGFSASPWEMQELGLELQRKGYLVYAPRIAGHGKSRKQFDAKGFKKWLASARAAWRAFKPLHSKRILIGHSGGGNLATLLALEHSGEISKLILGAPAFRLAPWTAPLSEIPLVRWFAPSLKFPAAHPDSKYWTLEYASDRVAELLWAGRAASRAALDLKLPLLMLQAKTDDLVSRRYNEKIFPKIPSADKALHVYDVAEHNVFHHYNPMQRQIFKWVEEFLGKA